MPKLKGSMQSPYSELTKVRSVNVTPDEVKNDPLVQQAISERDAAIEERVESSLSGSMDPPKQGDLTGSVQRVDPYEKHSVQEEVVGNGSTFPFRFLGRPTLAYTTCSEPEKDKNKGCPQWYRCPLRDLGSTYIIFRDDRNGRIMAETCINFIATGMAMSPNFTILPGMDYFYSEEVRWADHPDGTKVKAGPGEPKTHLEKKAAKNHLPGILPAEIMRQYQRLRIMGEVR